MIEPSSPLGTPDSEQVTVLQSSIELSSEPKEKLHDWFERLVRSLAPDRATATLRLTDEVEVAELNARYRQKPGSTDVLSFPGEKTPEGEHLGDVVIAVPVAARQARVAGHDLLRELRILALHGVLHCLGYDHETDDGEMERRERDLRRRWLNDHD